MPRQSSLAVVASFILLASAGSTNNNRPECLRNRSQELAALSSCGDEGSLNYCIANLVSTDAAIPIEQLTSELESCFVNAGCTNAESQIEALWTLNRCDEEPSELRRRRNGAIPLPREAAPIPGITMMAARQATDQPAPTAPANPSTLTCFTETSIDITSCPLQTTGAEAGKKLSCFPTVVPSSVCADGLICQIDAQGNPSCMVKQSKLPLEGIIIAIIFASFIVVSVISICFFCCKERRQQNRLIRAAEAAKIAAEAKTQAKVDAMKAGNRGGGGASDGMDRQPLMSQPAMPQQDSHYGGAGGAYQPAPGADYDAGHGQNPFTDAHPMR